MVESPLDMYSRVHLRDKSAEVNQNQTCLIIDNYRSVYAPPSDTMLLYMAEITSVMYMKQLCFQAPRHGR